MSILAYGCLYWLTLAVTFIFCQALLGPWEGWRSVRDAFNWPWIVGREIGKAMKRGDV